LFFNWSWIFIEAVGKNGKFYSEQYGDLPADDMVKNCGKKMEEEWEKMGDKKHDKYAMAWTIWNSFKWIYIGAITFAFFEFVFGAM
jgi:hypothetical protein